MNKIIIFEQDCPHVMEGELSPEWVREHLSYFVDDGEYPTLEDIPVVEEHNDALVLILQAFNEEGESWKFIQSKVHALAEQIVDLSEGGELHDIVNVAHSILQS